MSREKWMTLRNHWTRFNNWDLTISDFSRRTSYFHIRPCIARSNHIGANGINYKGGARDEDTFDHAHAEYDGNTEMLIYNNGDRKAFPNFHFAENNPHDSALRGATGSTKE